MSKKEFLSIPMSAVPEKGIEEFFISDAMISKNHLGAALAYAAYLPVFPIWGVKEGRCRCGVKNCESPGKHPIYSGGFKIATTMPDQIKKWWHEHPFANLGSPLVKGLTVLDFDKDAGFQTFTALKLPKPTLKVITGNGFHLYYLGKNLKTRNSALPGLDVRSGDNKGYIILPPSRHISGKRYRWEV